MSDLKDELEAIDGVGEATAEKILEVLDDYDSGESEEHPLVTKARKAAKDGDYRQASVWLARTDGE